jgi:hypothetical protein
LISKSGYESWCIVTTISLFMYEKTKKGAHSKRRNIYEFYEERCSFEIEWIKKRSSKALEIEVLMRKL